MTDHFYFLICRAHRFAKMISGRQREPSGLKFVDVGENDISREGFVRIERNTARNGKSLKVDLVKKEALYPVENAVLAGSNSHLRQSYQRLKVNRAQSSRVTSDFSPSLWRNFVDQASIPKGFRNEGLKYAGYIASGRDSWCLPSWIWTNAAIVRYLCDAGDVVQASQIGERLLERQEKAGGFIVRSDYTVEEEVPVLAPNDSAYIANNALLSLYRKTGENKWLLSAQLCADWIMSTARSDGLVWTGCNNKTGAWMKDYTIVDTGFTAGLFANLFLLTKDNRYYKFLEIFIYRFIELFFDSAKSAFATSIDVDNRKKGGSFARGQAWALEGLIPAYYVIADQGLRQVIDLCVENLLKRQLNNGAWAYNLDRPYYGEDCKGVPVIAKAIMDWHMITKDERFPVAAKAALRWCEGRTALSGESKGGIFSFNLEGAVVHNLYTSTAFVYSSGYALECMKMIYNNE